MKHFGLFLLFFLCFFSVVAQDSMPATPVVCYASEGNELSQLLPTLPANAARGDAAAVTFSITYDTNFPEAAKAAFQKAATIWSTYLVSQVPIHVKANWQSISGTTLAISGATKIYRNFSGAVYQNVWYPVPLAEALAGKELNSGEDDITVNLNSNFTWSYTTDGKPVAGKYDLTSVVLHELAHGLGFSGTFTVNSSSQGQWGQSSSGTIFDIFLQNAKNQLLTNTAIYGNPSTDLKTALTNNSLYFGLKDAKFANNLPKLYAPTTFADGTSVSHFDETTYPSGSANSLMSPKVQAGEVVQTPGDLLLNIFYQMGWLVTNASVVITGTENVPTQNAETVVFPNPSSDLLYVAIPDNGTIRNVQVEVLNQQGQLLQSLAEADISSKTLAIAISNLPTGLYFLRVSDKNQVITKKFVKE